MMTVLVLHPVELTTDQVAVLNILFGVLTAEFARCGSFWLGTSSSAIKRRDQALDAAYQAVPPARRAVGAAHGAPSRRAQPASPAAGLRRRGRAPSILEHIDRVEMGGNSHGGAGWTFDWSFNIGHVSAVATMIAGCFCVSTG